MLFYVSLVEVPVNGDGWQRLVIVDEHCPSCAMQEATQLLLHHVGGAAGLMYDGRGSRVPEGLEDRCRPFIGRLMTLEECEAHGLMGDVEPKDGAN